MSDLLWHNSDVMNFIFRSNAFLKWLNVLLATATFTFPLGHLHPNIGASYLCAVSHPHASWSHSPCSCAPVREGEWREGQKQEDNVSVLTFHKPCSRPSVLPGTQMSWWGTFLTSSSLSVPESSVGLQLYSFLSVFVFPRLVTESMGQDALRSETIPTHTYTLSAATIHTGSDVLSGRIKLVTYVLYYNICLGNI